jgi:hypothetical protein
MYRVRAGPRANVFSAIPIFNGLVGLIGALFATFLSIMLMVSYLYELDD